MIPQDAQKGQTSHPPNPGAPRRALPKQGRSRVETGGCTDRTSWGRSPVHWILANGKTPPVWPTSKNLYRHVEDFDEPRTTLAGFFSILLRSRWKFLRPQRHVLLLKSEMDDQEDDSHANRRVGNIEGRPMVGVYIDIEKIDYLAIP